MREFAEFCVTRHEGVSGPSTETRHIRGGVGGTSCVKAEWGSECSRIVWFRIDANERGEGVGLGRRTEGRRSSISGTVFLSGKAGV